jgi:hypothetical protein
LRVKYKSDEARDSDVPRKTEKQKRQRQHPTQPVPVSFLA